MNRILHKKLTQIARERLRIETLQERMSDSLDFHDCSVWGIKGALEAAYNLGCNLRRTTKRG